MEQNRTEHTKKAMVAALTKTLGVVTPALKMADVGRTTFYQWLKDDPEFAQEVDDLDDVSLDFAVHALHKKIKNGNIAAIIFYLKTQGKHRGFVERTETVFTDINVEMTDD
jgi:hypothetical protein